MNNEHAGERVFENVDEALAERIVSRAKENSKEPEPGCAIDIGINLNRINKPQRRPVSIMKIVIPVALILIGIWVLIRRGRR